MDTRAIPCLALVMALAACADRGEAPREDARPAADAAVPTEQAAPVAVDSAPIPAPAGAGAFDLEPKGAPVGALAPETPVLVDVRAAEHPGFDRLVFEFAADGLPQWRAEWVEIPITDCGAGQVVPVGGNAWLQLRFSGAAAHTPEGEATSGPRQRRLRHPVLRDLARTCDFEGEVTWVAGLAGRHPFRADTLSAPPRLVVDIAH